MDDWRFVAGRSGRPDGDDPRQEAPSVVDELDRLRRDCRLLEKETAVSASIALDMFRALRAADANRAVDMCDRMIFQYGRFRDQSSFPNLRDLLDGVVKECSQGRGDDSQ